MHTASKKYLAVNTTETSRTENTNLKVSATIIVLVMKFCYNFEFQVELSSRNSEGCIFKILPRYKVRSVGNEVRYHDQVKFESIKTEGQFLHCSSHHYRRVFSVLEQWFVHLLL